MTVFEKVGVFMGEEFGSKEDSANRKEGDMVGAVGVQKPKYQT